MALPKELRIILALVDLLEGINPTNLDIGLATDDSPVGLPYVPDLRGNVLIGRVEIGQEQPVPCLSILESPKPVDGVPAGEEKTRRHENKQFLLQGFVEDDKRNPTVPAYLFKAQVEERLGRMLRMNPDRMDRPLYPEHFRLGGLITGANIGQGVVRPPDTVSPKAYFYLPLLIGYTTDKSNPYAA